MKLTDEVVAELKQKHGQLYKAECDIGAVIFRHPSQADIDPYLLGAMVRGTEQEASNNLVYTCRVWPDVATVEKMFDEAPAVVSKFAETVADAAGGGETDLPGLVLRDLDKLTEAERAEVETKAGKTLDVIRNEHPRNCLRAVTLPGFGVAIFRRPTRSTYAPFVDAAKKDEVMDACRTMVAECAVTVGERDLAAVFTQKPAVAFFLAFALGSLAGTHLEVRSGKL